MGIEILHHEHDFFRIAVVHINQLSHEKRPVLLGATLAHSQQSLARQRFNGHKHTHGSMPLIFIVVTLWLSCLHWLPLALVGKQLLAAFIHTDLGKSWVIGTMIDLQNIFHMIDKLPILFGGNAPLLF